MIKHIKTTILIRNSVRSKSAKTSSDGKCCHGLILSPKPMILATKNVNVEPLNFHYFNVTTRKGFLRKNIVAVSFFQNCAKHPYS